MATSSLTDYVRCSVKQKNIERICESSIEGEGYR